MKWRVVKKKWRYLIFRITRFVYPKIKRFLNNIFYAIYSRRKDQISAIMIQSVIRMFLCRTRTLKMIGDYCFFEGKLFERTI